MNIKSSTEWVLQNFQQWTENHNELWITAQQPQYVEQCPTAHSIPIFNLWIVHSVGIFLLLLDFINFFISLFIDVQFSLIIDCPW